MVGCLPFLLLPRRFLMGAARGWARSNLFLMHYLTGTATQFRHLERIPQTGCLVASKHQSMWETFALFLACKDPAFVLKRELMWIPFFGWYVSKSDMIPVNRKGGARAMITMTDIARQKIKENRQIIIFPEGTRRAPSDPPAYKQGIGHLYDRLKVLCVPVALNSGVYWPRRQFIRKPGTIVVSVLDPVLPGMAKQDFLIKIQDLIETETNALMK